VPEIGPAELALLLVVAVLILGPSRLPDVGGAIGSAVREFRKAIREEDAEPEDNQNEGAKTSDKT